MTHVPCSGPISDSGDEIHAIFQLKISLTFNILRYQKRSTVAVNSRNQRSSERLRGMYSARDRDEYGRLGSAVSSHASYI